MLTVEDTLETTSIRISGGEGGATVGSKCTDVGALGLDVTDLVYCSASKEWTLLK